MVKASLDAINSPEVPLPLNNLYEQSLGFESTRVTRVINDLPPVQDTTDIVITVNTLPEGLLPFIVNTVGFIVTSGLPDISPVTEFRFNPAGRVPLSIENSVM